MGDIGGGLRLVERSWGWRSAFLKVLPRRKKVGIAVSVGVGLRDSGLGRGGTRISDETRVTSVCSSCRAC